MTDYTKFRRPCALWLNQLKVFIALIFIILFIFLNLHTLFGQYNETIRTGRPGAAIGGYTLGKKVFQVQSGITYNRVKATPDDHTNTFLHSNVIRWGVLEKFELSGVINWRVDNISLNGEKENHAGISNTQIGARYNILRQKGIIPAVGIQGRLLLSWQGKYYRRENPGARFILATGNAVNNWFAIVTNWGVSWESFNTKPVALYVINFSFQITKKVGAFIETYGTLNTFKANFDTGLSYLINNNLQWDASVGWQGTNTVSDWFVDTGISWRFDWREKLHQKSQ